MKMGRRGVMLVRSGPWAEAVVVFGAGARNELGPTSARPPSNPTLSPPARPGEHAEETAQPPRSPRRPGHVAGGVMDLIHRCCAGLDVHKKTVVACVRRLASDGQVSREVRTFRTMTADLIALADWLDAEGVT